LAGGFTEKEHIILNIAITLNLAIESN